MPPTLPPRSRSFFPRVLNVPQPFTPSEESGGGGVGPAPPPVSADVAWGRPGAGIPASNGGVAPRPRLPSVAHTQPMTHCPRVSLIRAPPDLLSTLRLHPAPACTPTNPFSPHRNGNGPARFPPVFPRSLSVLVWSRSKGFAIPIHCIGSAELSSESVPQQQMILFLQTVFFLFFFFVSAPVEFARAISSL